MSWTSNISLWWLIPLLIGCFLAAFYLYQKKGWILDVTEKSRYLLISLRALTIFFVILLLFGVVFEYKRYRSEKPILINVVDNSNSVLNYKDSVQVKQKLSELEENLRSKLSDKYEVVNLPLFENKDKMTFYGGATNISGHLESIRNLYVNRNIGAILLASDGNYNQGQSPLYAADGFNFVPFYTLGLGDTVQKKDQLIKDVVANEYAFYNNDFPISVEIEGRKMKNQQSKVQLFEDNRLIDQKSVVFENDFSFKQLTFQVKANKKGVHRYSITIPALPTEYNLKNNSREIYVEILESRKKVILLADAPHPDMTAIKGSFETNENIEVKSSLISAWDKNVANVDLVVWHEPGNNPNPSLFKFLQDKKVPIWFIIGPNSNPNSFIKTELGLLLSSNNQTDEIQPILNPSYDAFSISDELKLYLSEVPPILARYGKVQLPIGSNVFLNQRIGTVEKNEPLQFFFEKKGIKYGVLMGEGVWKWRLHNYIKSESFDLFNEWVNKTSQFLISSENRSPFVVQMPRKFDKNEDVVVNAEVYDKTMELTNKQDVNFQLYDEKGKLKRFVFSKTEKAYRLFMGKLKPGAYSWKASVNRFGVNLSKSGSFIVNDLKIEDLDNEANHMVLRQMSEKTKGKFYALTDIENLYQDLMKRDDITTVAFEESTFLELIDWKWFFVGLILLVSAEWFLRKWWGGY